jgi:ATP-binding cassette subfamily B protein
LNELKRYLPYLAKYRKKIAWGLFFVFVANISAVLVPRIVGDTVDMFSKPPIHQADVLGNIGIIIGLTFVSGIFMYFTRQTIIVASRLIEYDLRQDFLLAVESQPVSFFQENPTGTLMSNVTNDIAAAREFLGPAIMYGANTVVTFSLSLYFMLTIDVSTTLMALIPLPLIAVSTYFIGNRIYSTYKDVQAQFSELTRQAQESFSGIRVLRAYGREEYEQERFNAESLDYMHKNMKLARVQSLIMPVIMILVGLSLLIVLSWGGMQAIKGEISLGGLTQFFIYLTLLIWPVAAIGWISNLIQRASASATRLGKIFDLLKDIGPVAESSDNAECIHGDIDFVGVSFGYGQESGGILRDISISIPKGAFIGIAGAVGSGKTSLVQLLTGLYYPDKGDILIEGRNIKSIGIESLRKGLGYVQQDTFLFSDSILENIRLGAPDAGIEQVEKAVEIAGLIDDIDSYPEGYNTIIGERGITLSGGQKQRVAIARAIIRKPSLLILDDSFSAVDSETENRILNYLSSLDNKPTIILISHKFSSLKRADVIYFMEIGQITESGSHEALIGLKGNYYNMFFRQEIESEIERL